MDRFLLKDLVKWKDSPDRKPLVLRGVRQCGKTHLLRDIFGKEYFDDVAYFTFERNKALRGVFDDDLDVGRILRSLSMLRGKQISADTLIIFDEIQFCSAAIASLKYFCEDAPEYHVVAAGSLLGLKMPEERKDGNSDLSFPVGKVEFLTLRPMCFGEFVNAREGREFLDMIADAGPENGLSASALSILNGILDEYLCVGGMPEAVAKWISTENMEEVDKVLSNILLSYNNDFYKHAPEDVSHTIGQIWDSVPDQLSKENAHFYLDRAVKGSRSRDMDDAVQWLVDGGLVHRVKEISAPSSSTTEKRKIGVFKLYCCDVGLMRAMEDVDTSSLIMHDAGTEGFRGAQAENFVLNEILYSLGWRSSRARLAYWHSGRSEVDFVIGYKGSQIPIEVKSGEKIPKLVSLQRYCSEFGTDEALVFSRNGFKKSEGGFLFIPLAMAWRTADYLDEAIMNRKG